MISHITSPSYQAYLDSAIKDPNKKTKIDCTNLQKHYRSLSNTVHGKTDSGLPQSPDRYKVDKNGTEINLSLVLSVQNALTTLWDQRFPDLLNEIGQRLPQIAR